jgi:glutamate 5-kinase
MSVAVDEIEGAKIGDNDNLRPWWRTWWTPTSWYLLTDTAGCSPPIRHDPRPFIPRVERIDREIEALAGAAA